MLAWFGELNVTERRTMGACFGGWALDAFDVQMYSFVIPTVIALWGVSRGEAAAELVEVTYKPLPAVVAVDEAIKPGNPQLFDNAPNNICFDWQLGDRAAVDAAFALARAFRQS